MSDLADILKDSEFLNSIPKLTTGTINLDRPFCSDAVGKFDRYDGEVTFSFKFEYLKERQAFLKEHTLNEKVGDWTKLKVIEFGGFKHENVQMKFDTISGYFSTTTHQKDYCKALSLVLYVDEWLNQRF